MHRPAPRLAELAPSSGEGNITSSVGTGMALLTSADIAPCIPAAINSRPESSVIKLPDQESPLMRGNSTGWGVSRGARRGLLNLRSDKRFSF